MKRSRRSVQFTQQPFGTQAEPIAATPVELAGAAIDSQSVRNMFYRCFGSLLPDQMFAERTIISDDLYLRVDTTWILGMIAHDPLIANANSYVPDVFDCDDYVHWLRSQASLFALQNKLSAPLAVGTLMTTDHAFNVIIRLDGEVEIVNTQSAGHATEPDPEKFAGFLRLSPSNQLRSIYI